MDIELDIFDDEKVIKEAEALSEAASAHETLSNATALDAYFLNLGNYQQYSQKEQIKLAAEYHAEVKLCLGTLNKIPGKVSFLIDILNQILDGERIESFVISDKEIRKQEFFESLNQLCALKNPDLAHWKLRPTIVLNWSKQLIEQYHRLPQRPWIYKAIKTNQYALDDLTRWLEAVQKMEGVSLMPINQLAFYIEELKVHATKAETIFAGLVEANLKLVVAMAKKFQRRGLDLDDLIQEGNIGLMKGIERFQAARGFNVSTYVVWWIRQSITKALMNQGYVIRYPPAVHDLFRKINRLREEYQKAGRPEPSPRIMADRLETTIESVNAALTMFQVVSINQPVGDGEETLESVIPGEEGISIQEGEELREAIETLLLSLKPNERRILKLRYGLSGGLVSALNEVGADLKITRDHARQIEAKALAKLRKSLKVQAQKTRFC